MVETLDVVEGFDVVEAVVILVVVEEGTEDVFDSDDEDDVLVLVTNCVEDDEKDEKDDEEDDEEEDEEDREPMVLLELEDAFCDITSSVSAGVKAFAIALFAITADFMYSVRRLASPQSCVESPAHFMPHSVSAEAFTPVDAKVLPHQHSRPYSIPA